MRLFIASALAVALMLPAASAWSQEKKDAPIVEKLLRAALADPKQCRDDKGKFKKCPVAPAANKCRDKATKKFAKCDAPNTERVPAK